ncbi:MAG: type II secretion system protein M [Betaproteobacteria bacterium]|nr:type II secretion system protein M [Betaproteobacteria bacterium]
MEGAALRDRWSRLDARERRWLVVGAAVVAASLVYAFAWHPLVRDLPRAEREAERAQARLARAQDAVAVAATRVSTPARQPLDAAIRGSMARHGIAAADASLEIAGARAALTIPSVRFAAIVGLVDTLAREHAVHVVDATITARVEAGRVRAELSLAR